MPFRGFRRADDDPANSPGWFEPSIVAPEPTHRVSFGHKTGWVAAENTTESALADALGLTSAQEMSWVKGVEAAMDDGIFVCPSIGEWTLAMGRGLLVEHFDLAGLSQRLDTVVEYFRNYRIISYYSWARADRGVVTRDFAYIGESGQVLVNDGPITTVEENTEDAYDVVALPIGPIVMDDPDDFRFPSEYTVLEIAAGWSVDPSALFGPDDRSGIHGHEPN